MTVARACTVFLESYEAFLIRHGIRDERELALSHDYRESAYRVRRRVYDRRWLYL